MHKMRMRPKVPATEAIIMVFECLLHNEVEEGVDEGEGEVVVVE